MASTHASGSSHDDHDRLLMAAFAAGDADGEDLAKATRLSEGCESCRSLVADVRAVARAVASLPPARTDRDFRISADQAARLGRQAGWRRLLRPFAARRASMLGPVAATLMTIGFAGLVFGAGPAFIGGGSAGGAAVFGPTSASTTPESTGGAPAGELDFGAVRASAAPGDSSSGGSQPPDAKDTEQAAPNAATPPAPDRTALILVSGLLLVSGAGMVALRRLALRDR